MARAAKKKAAMTRERFFALMASLKAERESRIQRMPLSGAFRPRANRGKIERRLKRPGLFADLEKVLKEAFGARYYGLVLYGSQARGDVGPESDVDVLVLLDGPVDVVDDSNRAIEASYEVALGIEEPLSLIAASAQDFEHSEWSFYRNVREEALWL